MGTCRVTNTSSVLMVEGKQQVGLARGRDGQLLVNIEVYDAAGKHVARLRRNAWAFEQTDYTCHNPSAQPEARPRPFR